MIIYNCRNHYKYLQTHLHLIQTNLWASNVLKTNMRIHKFIKNTKLYKAWIELKLLIVMVLI